LYLFGPKNECISSLTTIKSHQITCSDCSKVIAEKVKKTMVETGTFELTENWRLNDMVRMAYNEYNGRRR